MRLVLDTNVVISGLLWFGTPRKVFDLIEKKGLMLFTSDALLKELTKTLEKKKFKKQITKLGVTPIALVTQYQNACVYLTPDPIFSLLLNDRDDEKVLECAVAADADIIVSGDHHLLDLVSFRGIHILSPEETVDHITQKGISDQSQVNRSST